MDIRTPSSPAEFADAWGESYQAGRRLRIQGAGSKLRFAGPISEADIAFDTSGLSSIGEYEPRDLTIRVGAGMPYMHLIKALEAEGQMLPLDPPFHDEATVGGVVAANLCGPRRRGYGTVRDYVIGVEFADAMGRLVQSGAMVAKNVAGYDLNKLFVGSWGVLGPMVNVNLRVSPIEKQTATFLVQGRTETEYRTMRDAALKGFTQPIAVDYVNATAGELLRLNGSALLIRYAHPPSVVERLRQSLDLPKPVEAELEPFLWLRLREWFQHQVSGYADGTLLQLSTVHSRLFADVTSLGGRVLARAASGVVYASYSDSQTALDTMRFLEEQGRNVLILSASDETRESRALCPMKPADLPVMEKVKAHFDPQGLVNRGRLHGWF
ncbi:MAG: FAD-binding protein [Bryobacterales bacterium]|nr:FAD-binding protein [Bryobacterales bacterium]